MSYAAMSEATCSEMLLKLKAAHVGLWACLAEMEELTARPAASRADYAAARFRISNASLKRRAIFNAVCAELRVSATRVEADTIARLLTADAALIKHSAQHVRSWPSDTIDANWPGYCKASRAIRQHMTEELKEVERHLVPLLEHRSLIYRAQRPQAA